MKKNIPVEKNKEYILDITGYGFEGEGVGKIDNFTVFVANALLGEKILVKILKVTKNFAFGKILEVLETSSDRMKEKCPIYKQCGGCQIQHFSYKAQLEFKKQRVIDSLERIGNLDLSKAQVSDAIGMEEPYRYRNKIQVPIREQNGEIKIGFYKPRTHEIVDIDKCFIQDEDADKIIKLTRKWIQDYKIPCYNEETGKGIVRHVMIRKAFKTDEIMVVLVTNKKEVPYIEQLIHIIEQNIKNVVSIIQNINNKKTNVVLGLKSITLWGKDTIADYIGKFKFNISPLSFFQVNPIQTEVLYNKALEFANLSGKEVVFDAYCGTGTISLFLSEKAKKVYGVEIIEEAIKNAKINAKNNNINNSEFFVGKCEEVIPKLINEGIKADVVVVDPPRKGCKKSLLEALVKMNPKKIVYVSCDPSTLGRDLKILNEFGYELKQVQPVDMFPQTAHIETVVMLQKNT